MGFDWDLVGCRHLKMWIWWDFTVKNVDMVGFSRTEVVRIPRW